MKLLHDNDKHNQYLIKMAQHDPNRILISTFGVYCGISKSGVDVTKEYGYPCETKHILDTMIKHCDNIDIVVGISRYTSCKGQYRCQDCEAKFILSIIRYANHVEYFPSVNWRYSLDSHLKAYLYYYDKASCGLVGGRNFTNSEWADISITINGEAFDDISKHVNETWDSAHEFDSNTSLYSICAKNGIHTEWVDQALEKGIV